jgi:hypothetical protein
VAERPNIVGLPKPEADDLSAAVDEFERKLPAMIRHHRLVAKLQRAAYENYLGAGFTPKQALELAKGIR